MSDIVEFPFFAHLNSVGKEGETGRRSGDKRSRDQKGATWKKLGPEGGRDLCITEGPERSSTQSGVFLCNYCVHEEPAVLRRALCFGIPGVLRSKAMLTCHVRTVSCTAPDHSKLVGKDSDREAGSLQAPKTKIILCGSSK